MPNIKEYSPSFDKIALPDAGSSAWETTGRHLGATYARMVADEKQQGKVIADILMQNKLYEAAVEPAATGGGSGKKAAAATGGGGLKLKGGSGDDFGQFKDWNKGFGSGSGGVSDGSDAAATGTGIAKALVTGNKGGKLVGGNLDTSTVQQKADQEQRAAEGKMNSNSGYPIGGDYNPSSTTGAQPSTGTWKSGTDINTGRNTGLTQPAQPQEEVNKDVKTQEYGDALSPPAPTSNWFSAGASAVSGWVGSLISGATTDSTETSSGGEG